MAVNIGQTCLATVCNLMMLCLCRLKRTIDNIGLTRSSRLTGLNAALDLHCIEQVTAVHQPCQGKTISTVSLPTSSMAHITVL